ncbi:MAG: rplY [Chlamydiales bacterium]|jgi:large subunit ribosomal protein L25|nr:rplY [Chlamydiales bacterium]
MKLVIKPRTGASKGEVKRIRREGDIPAVLYFKGSDTQNITIAGNAFSQILRAVAPGHLPTTVFTLDIDGKEVRAIIKDIQYDVITYKVNHLDFQGLSDTDQITINVPINCTGQVECVGIKLGGVMRQVIRHMKVRCSPKQIPTHFELDIRELGMKQSKRLSDIALPAGVIPAVDTKEVAVVIVKR